jgi:hypothetical protein
MAYSLNPQNPKKQSATILTYSVHIVRPLACLLRFVPSGFTPERLCRLILFFNEGDSQEQNVDNKIEIF